MDAQPLDPYLQSLLSSGSGHSLFRWRARTLPIHEREFHRRAPGQRDAWLFTVLGHAVTSLLGHPRALCIDSVLFSIPKRCKGSAERIRVVCAGRARDGIATTANLFEVWLQARHRRAKP